MYDVVYLAVIHTLINPCQCSLQNQTLPIVRKVNTGSDGLKSKIPANIECLVLRTSIYF